MNIRGNKMNQFQKPKRKPFDAPFVTTLKNECIYISLHDERTLGQFLAMARILRISKGENFDVITVQLGLTKKARDIVVTNNHARRQLLTCKRGCFAQIFGECRIAKRKNSMGFVYKEWELFAWAIQGWYVPKMFDVRKREKDIADGIEEDETLPMSEEQKDFYKDVVEEILDKNFYELDDEYHDRKRAEKDDK